MPPQYFGQMSRMQPLSRTNGSHVLSREQIPALHVLHHEERAPKNATARLLVADPEVNSSQSLLGSSHSVHHGLEFPWLKRKRAVRPRRRSRQRDVLLDDARTQRNPRDWNRNSQRVVGKSHRHTEPPG